MAENRPYRWLHKYRLRFGTPMNISKSLNENSSFTKPIDIDENIQQSKDKKNAYELTTHQISFTITKDNSKEPNKSSITIVNLDDDLVNYITNNIENTLAIVLEAGYTGEIKTIFKGTVSKIIDKWSGNTRETLLKCTDGGANVKEAVTSRSYPAGTSVKKVIKDLSSDLGTNVGRIEIDSNLTTFNAPVAFIGSTANQLSKLTDSLKHNFSIQDGATYVTPREKRLPQISAYLSDETGLKTYPTPLSTGEKKNKKNKTPANGVSFECQIDGSILPESTVYVKSRDIDSAFKVTKVQHKGSYESDDWTTEIEAVKVDAVIKG